MMSFIFWFTRFRSPRRTHRFGRAFIVVLLLGLLSVVPVVLSDDPTPVPGADRTSNRLRTELIVEADIVIESEAELEKPFEYSCSVEWWCEPNQSNTNRNKNSVSQKQALYQ